MYYSKYLKYKIKYLELKNQIGGCPEKSILCNFINNNCDEKCGTKCDDEYKNLLKKCKKALRIRDFKTKRF